MHKSIENYKCIYTALRLKPRKVLYYTFFKLIAIHVQGLACGYHILVSVRNKYVIYIYFDTPERTTIYWPLLLSLLLVSELFLYTFLLEGICLKWSVKVPYGCNKLLNISSSYLPTKIQRNSIDILPSYLTRILFHTYQFKNVFIIYKYVYLQRPWFSEYHTNVLENTGVIFFWKK